MKNTYSFKKSLIKGATFVLQLVGTSLVVLNLSDISVWDLIVQYVKPVASTITLGGLVVIATNFIKYNYASE